MAADTDFSGVVTGEEQDYLDGLDRQALIEHSALDERPTWDTPLEQKVRQALAGPQRAAVYRRLVTASPRLTDAEVRFLCTLTYRWGSGLTNCFPSRRTMHLGFAGPKRRTVARIDQLVRSCERKEFLRRVHLTRAEDGELQEITHGRFISAVGYQFLLPPGAISENAGPWEGPRSWTARQYAKRSPARSP